MVSISNDLENENLIRRFNFIALGLNQMHAEFSIDIIYNKSFTTFSKFNIDR